MWNPLKRKRSSDGNSTGNDPVYADKKGWLRWPGRVIPRPIKKSQREALRLAAEAFKVDRPTCPDCHQGALLPVDGDPLSRQCDACGTKITLNTLAQASAPTLHYSPAKRRNYFLRQATTMFVVTCVLLSCAALFSAWQGSMLMLMGALILSAPLFMFVFAMRYRAWQADTGRFYEVEAPLGDFVRDELRALFSVSDRPNGPQ